MSASVTGSNVVRLGMSILAWRLRVGRRVAPASSRPRGRRHVNHHQAGRPARGRPPCHPASWAPRPAVVCRMSGSGANFCAPVRMRLTGDDTVITPRRSAILCTLAALPGLAGAPHASYRQHPAPPTVIVWVKYTEPTEHAFTVDGPRGYTVKPLEVRRGPIDYVLQTRAVAPDSSIDVRINDGSIPAFSEPTPLNERLGLHPGMMTESRGQRFMIRSYVPALPFAYDYAKQMMAPFCAQPALKAARPLPAPACAAPATPL